MQTLWEDMRYGARMLLKKPGFTSIAALTLSLGIGACTAIFSIVDAVLLRPLPYPGADRVVQAREMSEGGARMAFADPNFRDVRERNRSLEAVAEYGGSVEGITAGRDPLPARAHAASAVFFPLLGPSPPSA